MIELKIYINTKKHPENEKPKIVINIVTKILRFDKKQKGKGLPMDLAKISNHKVSDHKHIEIFIFFSLCNSNGDFFLVFYFDDSDAAFSPNAFLLASRIIEP